MTSRSILDLPIIAIISAIGGLLIAGSPGIFRDGDVSWHIAAGQWMIDHRSIPLIDPFSYTALGHRWLAHEWLGELLMGISYRLAGFPGVGILTMTAVVATLAMAGLWMRRWANAPELALALILMFDALGPFVHARPMVLAWPLLCGWTMLLLKARDRGDLPPPWWTVGLMILWINLHASWAIGMLLAGAFGLEAVIASSRRVDAARRWALYGLALLSAALINPNFTDTLLIPIHAFTSPSITAIQEFKPTDFNLTPAFEVILLLVLGAGWLRGARLGAIRVLVMLAMLYLALAHMRHQTLFLIIGAFVLVPPLTRRWVDGLGAKPKLAAAMGLGRNGTMILATGGAALFAVFVGARLLQPFDPLEGTINPVRGFAAIPADLRSQPVLNDYSLGGPLILRGIRPFVDGRGDVYGEQFFSEYVKIRDGDAAAFAAADHKWHFRWAMTLPSSGPMLHLLDRQPGWHRLYADRNTVIHVRDAR